MACDPPNHVTPSPLVFLDANVLFSAAVGGEVFDLLFQLELRGKVRFVTSRACELEARRNLERKRPDKTDALADILRAAPPADVDPSEHLSWARALVGDADAHVLAAARSLAAVTLVTGDLTHFGLLLERGDLPLTIRTPRAFLMEGPPRRPPSTG
jgi:predicted nucleic acid-binding protein